ncbi:MAG: DUF5665 domain-containing protein [Patescibacteria group bacterium]|nr:DUF5665 domain-containing protein [Patescibacteria group bacterium]
MTEMTDQIYHRFSANSTIRRRDIIFNNLLGGIAWGLGSAIGATVILALIISILRQINLVPAIGGFIGGILDVANNTQ